MRAPLIKSVSEFNKTCSRAKNRYASTPTSASTRRTPAPIEDSLSSLITPNCPERATCVPPQSSRAQSPTLTTRTTSPYFSPNNAMAPSSLAFAWLMLSAVTSRLSNRRVLTRDSTSFRTLTGTEPVAGKSKRNRPGEFSEPAWVAVSPRISLKAL